MVKKNVKDLENFNTSFKVGKLNVIIHYPSLEVSDEENQKQLAKYLYKLLEMDNKKMQSET